jgi:hypothetical protein
VNAAARRRVRRRAEVRLSAAIELAPRLIVCEALLAGVAVPAHRLDRAWVSALGLKGEVRLSDELAFRVVASLPLVERAA